MASRHEVAVLEARRVLSRLEGALINADVYKRRDEILYALLAFGDRQECGEWKERGIQITMPTPDQLAAAKTLAAAALASCAKTSFTLPDVQVAIAIFESGWLAAAPGCNCCGTKHHGNLPWQLIGTHEWFTPAQAAAFLAVDPRRRCELASLSDAGPDPDGRRLRYFAEDVFSSFASYEECFTDQAQNFLMGGETGRAAWEAFQRVGDSYSYVRAIAVHYSTTAGYAEQIIAEASSGTVRNALQAARFDFTGKVAT